MLKDRMGADDSKPGQASSSSSSSPPPSSSPPSSKTDDLPSEPMLAASGPSSSSSSSSAGERQSSPTSDLPSEPMLAATPSSMSSSDSLHAQAVRFLTSLRSQSPDSTTEAQRDFLRSKGLSEEAIDAAFKDAQRPENLTTEDHGSLAKRSTGDSDSDVFDQASRAFENPINVPMPAVPAKNYPRSPLALYYEEAQGRAEEARIREEKSRRYAVLLDFFRTLSWLLTLGGGLTGIGVMLYRIYLMPKLVDTLDARSSLLKHHHSLWNKVLASITSLKASSLAPQRPTVEASSTAADTASEDASRKAGPKKVQFADEVGGGQLEHREGDPLLSPPSSTGKVSKETNVVLPSTDVVVPAPALKDAERPSADEEVADEAQQPDEAAVAVQLEPIDLSAPLRASLEALTARLRGREATAAVSTQPSAAMVEDASDASDEESSDSWEDEVEFDPFSSSTSNKKSKKGPTAAKKHSPPPVSATPARSSDSSLHEAASASSALYQSLTSLNASANARHLYFSTRGNLRSGMTNFSFVVPPSSSSSSSSTTTSSSSQKDNGIDNDKTLETAAQIRAEIRSLKGLLLSRRNFPTRSTTAGTATPPPALPASTAV